MFDWMTSFDEWLLRTTCGGGALLLAGALAMTLTRQPVKRQRLGELSLMAALLVACIAALPAWWEPKKAFTKETTPNDLVVSVATPATNASLVLDASVQFLLSEAATINSFMPIAESSTIGSAATAPPILNTAPWFSWLQLLRFIGGMYLLVVLYMLGRCTIGYIGLWRYWHRRRPAPAHLHSLLEELEPDAIRRPRLGLCDWVHGPVSYGLWKPTILLPPSFCYSTEQREHLRWILAHELSHLQRRDPWGCLLLALGGALYFHLPWFWWMKKHVRLAQEFLADAAAAQLASAVKWAEYLVSLTTLETKPTLASGSATGVFDSPSDLYRRVNMLLNSRSPMDGRCPRWWTAAAAASFMALAGVTAGANPMADDSIRKEIIEEVYTEVQDDGKKFEAKPDGKKENAYRIVTTTANDSERTKKIDAAIAKIDASLKKLDSDDASVKTLKEVREMLVGLKTNALKLTSTSEFKPVEVKPLVKTLTKLRPDSTVDDEAIKASEGAKVRLKLAMEQLEKAKDAGTEAVNKELARAKAELAKAQAELDSLQMKRDVVERNKRIQAEVELQKNRAEKDSNEFRIRLKDEAEKVKSEAMEQAKKAKLQSEVAKTKALEFVRKAKDQQATATVSSKGRMGIITAKLNGDVASVVDLPEGQGLMIAKVNEDTPASKAGLKANDILVNFAGKPVPADEDAFREFVLKLPAGEHKAVVLRKGKKQVIVVNLGEVKQSLNLKDAVEVALSHDQALLLERGNRLADKEASALLSLEGVLKVADPKLDVISVGPGKLANLDGKLTLTTEGRTTTPILLATPRETVNIATPLDSGEPLKLTGKLVRLAQDQDVAQPAKPRLGIQFGPIPENVAAQIDVSEGQGMMVQEVIEGTVAAKAGFQKNDVLVTFGGKSVPADAEELSAMIRSAKAGKTEAVVLRKGRKSVLRFELPEVTESKPAAPAAPAKPAKPAAGQGAKEPVPPAKPAKPAKPGEQADKGKEKLNPNEFIFEGDMKAEDVAKLKEKMKKLQDGEDQTAEKGLKPDSGLGQRNNQQWQMSNNNGLVKINVKDNDAEINIEGKQNGTALDVSKIVYKSGDTTTTYKGVKDIKDAEVKEKVEAVLAKVKMGNNNMRFFRMPNNLNNFNNFNQFNNEEFMKQLEKNNQEIFKRLQELNKDGQFNFNFDNEEFQKQFPKMNEELQKQLQDLRRIREKAINGGKSNKDKNDDQ